jgi:large conductance mechanosensitive channel
MLRRSATFLFSGRFLARASLFELAAGLMITLSLQRVFERLVFDIVVPVIALLVGRLDFSDSFLGLSRLPMATF